MITAKRDRLLVYTAIHISLPRLVQGFLCNMSMNGRWFPPLRYQTRPPEQLTRLHSKLWGSIRAL